VGGGGGAEPQRFPLPSAAASPHLMLQHLLGVAERVGGVAYHCGRLVAGAQLQEVGGVRLVTQVAQPLECGKQERVEPQARRKRLLRLRNPLRLLKTKTNKLVTFRKLK